MLYDDDGERIGYATSLMYSPMLQRHIAMARVQPDVAAPSARASTSSSPSTTSTRQSRPTWPGSRCSTHHERRPDTMANKTKNYDAIIVGGGHNGLVNGAYLAKAGLKVLIIERRHLVGGAAITEELRPASTSRPSRTR